MRDGRDASLAPLARAERLFAAAVMTRTNGMELFGTELEPDWSGGDGFTWQDRATNSFAAKINLADADEIGRASSRQVDPDKRYHYRWQAAALAWESAQLMPNNTDDTARVLCTGGTWLKYIDPQAADKFYKSLVRRCRKTAVGDQADKMRWFPAQSVDGNRPRLETVEITAELTNAVSRNGDDVFSTEFPMPGRKYEISETVDAYIIARAVQRLGYPMRAEDILKANPGLKRGQIRFGRVIMIPAMPEGADNPAK